MLKKALNGGPPMNADKRGFKTTALLALIGVDLRLNAFRSLLGLRRHVVAEAESLADTRGSD